MPSRIPCWVLVLLLCLPVAAWAQQARPAPTSDEAESPLDIPYQKFILSNGLTLIVHEDHKAPVVAVNVWYHVGSKNEKPGKTGFAHLFEHLMFNGSEHFNDDYFQVLERVGATDLNGTTNSDRTNYFQTVPVNALEQVLWMESDRMGHLLGAIDQAKLDEQRGVVQNEKREGENQPYGRVYDVITENVYPEGHPYSWTTIGSMEDLQAASLEDVHAWFETYYGAANATVVIAGDIDAETVRARVEHYFGDIPSGPPIVKQQAWVAKRTGEHRTTMEDRVPQARLYKVWNVPQWGALDRDRLELVAGVLSNGKPSRLYKRLVYDDQIASDVDASVHSSEIGSLFIIRATARPGVDLADVEAAVDEELARFLAEGPTDRELRRVRTQTLAGFIRGAERVGGFGGKSDILAEYEVYGGAPDLYQRYLRRIQEAAPSDLLQAARAWLSDGVFALTVHPFPDYATAETGADRSALPAAGPPPTAAFPALQTATLSNGLKVVLAERRAVPVVDFALLLDAGYAADQSAAPGTAKLALSMLDEGTRTRSALEISEALALLGATLYTGSSLDVSTVVLSALKAELAPALDLFADVILRPAFAEDEFARQKQQHLVGIQQEKAAPVAIALRIIPGLLYGDDHAYGLPLTGSGSQASVQGITRADLVRFHDTWFRPNNATLVVVGDVDMAQLQPMLEARFGGWKAGRVPEKNIAPVSLASEPSVYLVDRPGAEQSLLIAGHVAPPKVNPDEVAIETMNTVLGGAFTSRINMNLREDKHWAYGAFSLLWDARGQRPFIIYAPVQTDKTSESMQEIQQELTGILGARPVTPDELAKVQQNLTLKLPGQWETNGAVMNAIAETVEFDLPDDHITTYAERVHALNLDRVAAAARTVVRPDRLIWVVVGDRAKIEPGIKGLGLGAIRYLDADGNPLPAGSGGSGGTR